MGRQQVEKGQTGTPAVAGPGSGRSRVAYVVSSFPVVSETFVLFDALAMERAGVDIIIYPLLRRRPSLKHRAAQELRATVIDLPLFSVAILAAQFAVFLRRPWRYIRTLFEVLAGTIVSPRYFLGAVVLFPKSVWLSRHMQAQGVTHIHAHFANHPATVAYIVSRLTGIPFSFTARGSDIHRDKTMLDTKLQHAAFAIAVSENNRKVMLEACGPAARDKVHVIHGGVDLSSFRAIKSQRDGGLLNILCVARLEPFKGHRYLLQACALMRDRGLSFRCQLIGEGHLREELEREVERLGLGDSVNLVGARPHEDVVAALGSADIAVLCSAGSRRGESEGIPNVLKEAMAAGVPVVASDIGGVSELVEHGENGLLVKPGDASALSDAMLLLASSAALRRKLGSNGRSRIEQDFDLADATRRRAELFLARYAR